MENPFEVILKEIKHLNNKVDQLTKKIETLQNKGYSDPYKLLSAEDVMNEMDWSRMTLHRRLYESDTSLPMVKDGGKLKITRAKFDRYKREIYGDNKP